MTSIGNIKSARKKSLEFSDCTGAAQSRRVKSISGLRKGPRIKEPAFKKTRNERSRLIRGINGIIGECQKARS